MVEQDKPLSDSQWEGIKNFLNPERKRKIDLRRVVDAIRYILRGGIQWRALPECYPKWKSVYYYFNKWEADGTMMGSTHGLMPRIEKRKIERESPL